MMGKLLAGRLPAPASLLRPAWLNRGTAGAELLSRRSRDFSSGAPTFHTQAAAAATSSDEYASGYRAPPAEILDIVETPPEPLYSFSPDRKLVLQLSRPPINPPIAEFARPELKLAGECG